MFKDPVTGQNSIGINPSIFSGNFFNSGQASGIIEDRFDNAIVGIRNFFDNIGHSVGDTVGSVFGGFPQEIFPATSESSSSSVDFEREYLDRLFSYNSAEAQKNRDWQKMLSDTSYQRAVADLRKAGLNPVLAISGLSGATSPSGSAGSMSSGYTYAGQQASASSVKAGANVLSAVLQFVSSLVSSYAHATSR